MNIHNAFPKGSVRNWCEKHPDRVRDADYGGGYSTDSGKAYDILLERGWSTSEQGLHTIIEGTAKEALAELRGIEPCECHDCVTGDGWGE